MIPIEIIKVTTDEGTLNLVGKFPGPHPNIDSVQKWAFQKWQTKGRFDIVAILNGHFLIKFFNEDDLKVLYGGP